MKKGRIVILSGPSGSGKTTLHSRLLKSPQLKGKIIKSVSATTRPKRPHEKEGQDYLFISKKMFLHKRRLGYFLESEKVFNDYYGTPKKQVQALLRKGKNVLLCIDVKGARTVRRKYPEALKIFIKPPSFKELRKRLTTRGTETRRDLAFRLRTAKKELLDAKDYDFIVVNDVLPKAYKKLEDILGRHLS